MNAYEIDRVHYKSFYIIIIGRDMENEKQPATTHHAPAIYHHSHTHSFPPVARPSAYVYTYPTYWTRVNQKS